MAKTKTRIMKLQILVTGNSNIDEFKQLINDNVNKDWMGVTYVDFKLIQTSFEDTIYYTVVVYFENTNKQLFYSYSCQLAARLQQALEKFQNKKEAVIYDIWSNTL